MDMPEEREPLVFAPVLHSSYDGEKSVFGATYGEEKSRSRNPSRHEPHHFTGDAKEFNSQFTHSQIPGEHSHQRQSPALVLVNCAVTG